MKAALRIAWAMTSIAVLVLAAVVTALVVVMVTTNSKVAEALVPMAVPVTLIFLARRIALVTESGIWRYLPGGPHALVRGVGVVLLTATLWLGGLYSWAAPGRFFPLPFGHVLAVWLPFSLLGFALLAGAGRRLPRSLPLAYVGVCIMAFGSMMNLHAHKQWMWIAMTLVCAAAWLVAAFGKLPRGFAGTATAAGLRPGERATSTANRTIIGRRSPTLTLLRTGKSSGSIVVSILVLIVFAVFQNSVLGGLRPAENFRIQSWMTIWASAFLVFALGTPLAERSRRLWLRLGESRGDVFRICERLLLRDALVLAACGWVVVVLLGIRRGLSIETAEAARLFAVYLGSALLPIYLSLGLSTLHSGWTRVPAALVAVGALALWPFFWLRAFDVTNAGFGTAMRGASGASLLVLLVVATVSRWFALRRWSTIDWARFRPRGLV